jgi:protein-S-isoprenylcysteine O-methyltransferase Ste14
VFVNPRFLLDCCWAVLMIVWGVGALRAGPVARRQSSASRLAHLLPLGVCCFLLLGIGSFSLLARRFVPDTARVGWIGVALAATGNAFAIGARFFLGPNWSGMVTVKKDHRLIRQGPYAVVRHPIYSGILLGLVGTAIVIGEVRGLIAVALAVLGFRLQSLQEERFMEDEFDGEYREYKKRVKAIIPFVW